MYFEDGLILLPFVYANSIAKKPNLASSAAAENQNVVNFVIYRLSYVLFTLHYFQSLRFPLSAQSPSESCRLASPPLTQSPK